MRIYKILLFIFGILAGLSALCIFMPSEGIRIAGITLEFPSLLHVLEGDVQEESTDTIEILSPEELLAQRMANLHTQKVDEFHEFASHSPQRIYLPHGDETYFDSFFQSLEEADSQHVRILHLGDSQLECDRISSSLRTHYQQTFGGHGVGLVPALQTVPTYTLSQTISPSESVGHYVIYGPADMHASHSRYGIMGQVNHVPSGSTLRLSARDLEDYPTCGSFRKVTVMAHGAGSMTLRANGTSYSMKESTVNESYTAYTTILETGVDAVTISFSGDFDIYGVQLDDIQGVSLDNVPMRGCSGNMFTRIDKQTLSPFFDQENVRLIILQYGGNYVPVCSSADIISDYMKSLRRQIALFKQMAPKASILFVGPADMATRMGGEMKTYKALPQLVDSLRSMSAQAGIAFWDMFSAMGGKGSIVKWYRAKPQLAGGDFIHFTPKGAQKMADMLYGTLQLYYRFYRLRMGKESETEMQDLEFKDAVAPVEGSGVISISELPPRPASDSVLSNASFDEAPDSESSIDGGSPSLPSEPSVTITSTNDSI